MAKPRGASILWIKARKRSQIWKRESSRLSKSFVTYTPLVSSKKFWASIQWSFYIPQGGSFFVLYAAACRGTTEGRLRHCSNFLAVLGDSCLVPALPLDPLLFFHRPPERPNCCKSDYSSSRGKTLLWLHIFHRVIRIPELGI